MKIKVMQNGPYVVSGGVPLMEMSMHIDPDGDARGWDQGEEIGAGPDYALCRCGGSGGKPFCDGTHARNRFDGTESASLAIRADGAQKTDGPALALLDVEELCVSARFCHRAGGTWALVERSDDPAARGAAIEEAGDCPGGRLTVFDKKTGKAIEPKMEPSIGLVFDPVARVDGPIWARGGIPLEAADGRAYATRNRATLCRCGKSGNKPFCDGSHLY